MAMKTYTFFNTESDYKLAGPYVGREDLDFKELEKTFRELHIEVVITDWEFIC